MFSALLLFDDGFASVTEILCTEKLKLSICIKAIPVYFMAEVGLEALEYDTHKGGSTMNTPKLSPGGPVQFRTLQP